ncbi:hypothetical protein [Micromonospora sp. NPDC049679]|uniref:hypothetical protein n=1 Tax=Micromonospora sp. NPDC049679 TaxID=3155920 RepID=UPI0033C7395F
MADPERRRRRLRHSPPAGAPRGADDSANGRSAVTGEVQDPEPVAPASRRGGGTGGSAEDRETERGLRGLVGSGASQVSVTAALRARDATRPSDDDLAAAEERLVIVRRNWVPREDVPRSGR